MAKAIARTLVAMVVVLGVLQLSACSCDCELSVGIKRSLDVSAAELEGARLSACSDERCRTATIKQRTCFFEDGSDEYPFFFCDVLESDGHAELQASVRLWHDDDEVSLTLTRESGERLVEVRGVPRSTSSEGVLPLTCDCTPYEL